MEKVIHYCWFGGSPLTETANKAIASWKKYAPGFEIKRWDETNFDIACCDFVRDAYVAHRWAFVSDYVRYKVLCEHGGIYMDIGTILIKDIIELLDKVPFTAMEYQTKTASPGLIMACEPGDPVAQEILANYEVLKFEDSNEFFDLHTVNEMTSSVLEKHGFERVRREQKIAGWTILPYQAFNPVYGLGGYHITSETFSVHEGSSSWQRPMERSKQAFVRRYAPYIGKRPAEIFGRICWGLKDRLSRHRGNGVG